MFNDFFFFNDTATTEIYTLSLHDALPICNATDRASGYSFCHSKAAGRSSGRRSEEHTSELKSQSNLVCRLLLEKKKTKYKATVIHAKLPDADTPDSTPPTQAHAHLHKHVR